MPLDAYKRKRTFAKTPEPEGTVETRKAGELFFCVQKHLASHPHYDIRLEHNGVLLSWAVPKRPSLDPTIRRLAMQTEDHPFAYGEFEGVIPEGYGAGIVMLWDRGTWTPEVADVDAALKGSWVLIKHKDDWGGDLDIAEFAPMSVKSGGDFEDILAEDNPAIWQTNRPAKGGESGAMLATIVERAAALKAARTEQEQRVKATETRRARRSSSKS